jgi:molybdenum-dependent DNA-binding transcriptional regulator ModE
MLGMSNESPPPTTPSLSRGRPRRRLPRVPAFYPVPVRQTHNGWSPQRQAHFLGWLAETGSVSAAWDAALGMPIRRVTIGDLEFLAYHGLVKPRFRGGKYIGSRPKPSASALLRLLARYDRVIERTGRTG